MVLGEGGKGKLKLFFLKLVWFGCYDKHGAGIDVKPQHAAGDLQGDLSV